MASCRWPADCRTSPRRRPPRPRSRCSVTGGWALRRTRSTWVRCRAWPRSSWRPSKANRELLLSLVRAEVDRAVAAFGLASRDEVAALRRQVERLQRDLAATTAPATRRSAKKTTAKKSAAKKSAAKQSAAKKSTATKPAAAPAATAMATATAPSTTPTPTAAPALTRSDASPDAAAAEARRRRPAG